MSSSSRKMLQAAAGSAGGDFYDYTIDNSVRFNYGDSPKLTRTPPTPTDSKKFTYSVWIKRSNTGSGGTDGAFMLGAATDNANYAHIHIQADYFWYIDYNGSNTTSLRTYQKKLFRDTSAWYHVVVAVDTTQATSTNRVKIYFNGEQFTDWSTGTTSDTYPAQNYVTRLNNTILQTIGTGAQPAYSTWYYNGYLAEATFIDGQQLPATDFGETKNGVWIPKDVSGLTFGNSGFYLKFANSGALGTDSSGNGNNFTVTGLTSSDQMIDTPTNNFATLNPLASSARTTLYDGNLRSYGNDSIEDSLDYSTIAVTSGKWYWEEKILGISTAASYPCVGVARIIKQPSNGLSTGNASGGGVGYFRNGNVQKEGSSVATYATFTTNDVIGVALDVDNLQISFYKNGTLQGTVTGLTSSIYYMSNTNYSTSQTSTNFGQTSFAYTPPAGFNTLCTANLPEPAIGPNSTTTSGENFNTVLYTGNGSTQSVTGVGFQPDFTWVKKRSGVERHVLFDAVRGAGYQLSSDLTVAEVYLNYTLTSFDSDGFSNGNNGYTNESGHTYVAWNWKANGSGVSNTDGTITSTVSANTDAGISIVKYTATGSAATVGHGLGVAPSVVIVKAATIGGNWSIYHKSNGAAYTLLFTTDGLYGPNSTWFNSTEPTSSVFSIGSGTGTNWYPYNFIAYCFAEVEGFSSFGKYTGNGSADGPFIYTGFRPAWIMFKCATQAFNNWYIHDAKRNTYNLADRRLYPSDAGPEGSGGGYGVDINSNGYKIRNTDSGWNGSGQTYIYMAFAEMPFKYSVGR